MNYNKNLDQHFALFVMGFQSY